MTARGRCLYDRSTVQRAELAASPTTGSLHLPCNVTRASDAEIPGISPERRVRIECAIAKGWGVLRTSRRIGCAVEDIVAVWCRMEELVRQLEVIRQPRRSTRHGTYGGYRKHQRDDETACPSCRTAYAEYRHGERTRKAVSA